MSEKYAKVSESYIECKLLILLKLAEAHGNRTHPGSFSPPTPVLKTGRPTSDRRASVTEFIWMAYVAA